MIPSISIPPSVPGRVGDAHAVGVMVVAVVAGLAMRPVDLSSGGAVSTFGIFVSAGVLGLGVRNRKERFEADSVVCLALALPTQGARP